DVFLARDTKFREFAAKCCEIDSETGIPNILETSIMASMIHPYLNHSLSIETRENKLYIIQELAITDLANYTRIDRKNYRPSIDELRNWCYYLAQALSTLHVQEIIHADIKASNILLYKNKVVRLSDYTLSTKKRTKDEKFKHSV